MKEKKNKSPKDIEKRKAKTKKIIFFILHGISYILSLMFIGALVIGGCSQKANTYKSASAVYNDDKILRISDINLNLDNHYHYQLFSENPSYNFPSLSVINSYLDIDENSAWQILLDYNNLLSKSGSNAITRIQFSSNSFSIQGRSISEDSILPSIFSVNILQRPSDSARYENSYVLRDLSNQTFTTDVPIQYVLSEFFDGVISILNYSSFSKTESITSSDDDVLRFICFYLSEYSIVNVNTAFNTDINWWYNLVGYKDPSTPYGFQYTYTYGASYDLTYSFLVGDYSYNGIYYDTIKVSIHSFDSVYKYYLYNGRYFDGSTLSQGSAKPPMFFIKNISFYNSYTDVSYDAISINIGEYSTGVYFVSNYSYNINSTYQIVRIHNYASYKEGYDTISFPLSNITKYKIDLRAQIFKVLNYSTDVTGNSGEALIGVFDIISNAFRGLGGLLSIALLPSITIGMLLAIPVVMILVLFIIKMFKR